MKRLTLLVIAAALAWSAYWGWSAWAQRQAIKAWFEDRRAEGWEASYDDLSIQGFPNRLDTSFTGLLLADPDSNTVWEAPFLQVLQVVYSRDHVIVAFPESQRISHDGNAYEITAQGLRASLVRDGGELLRANAEAEVLNVSGEAPLALSGLTAAISRLEESDSRYRIAVNAEGIATGGAALPGGSEDGLRLDSTVTLEAPLRLEDYTEARPTRIEIARAELGKDALRLSAAGAADVDRSGRLDGELSLRVENMDEAIAAERAAGRVPPEILTLIEGAADLLSGLSGRDDRIDLTFEFREGKTWLGFLPLGPAPKLR
ncbi:DUF2125 domain-containing protein [Salipiger abyssi]|uniref:DUF2125 domain-containing protein n=1 Tax=Salipiger abyssi TaxID=1250539 RepID=UPI001A8D546A|nr:DUF2125 domain-containing protein [Salipiger abyssi]MBN9888728.1 DUF2125 domain-containing protein [Salipiger abyssi]